MRLIMEETKPPGAEFHRLARTDNTDLIEVYAFIRFDALHIATIS